MSTSEFVFTVHLSETVFSKQVLLQQLFSLSFSLQLKVSHHRQYFFYILPTLLTSTLSHAGTFVVQYVCFFLLLLLLLRA